MYRQMGDHGDDLSRLVATAQGGDATSRDHLLRLVRSAVLRYALARGLPDDDAQDLAQDTCLGVLRALPGWQDLGRSVWAFVFAIARNKLTDRARAHAARKDVPMGEDAAAAEALMDPRPGPAELVEDDEGTARVRALLLALPATQREVLLLRVIVGLSAAETAAALQLTVGSVRVLQHRAVSALRPQLTPTPKSTA
ncbi:sigma-70 family RNA polymerase sigma factor [Dactylosporangium darangshiense]|uniref:Sigma-70 family RNA polymerase sigma factor n=1 Tax=Dactylosporangium darangshiense TaxID=579108 RepID=A0ABP8DW02_9ACTN